VTTPDVLRADRDAPATTPSDPPPTAPPDGPLFGPVASSEWTKLRSVPSTAWSLLATVGITAALGALLSWAYVHRYPRIAVRDRLTFDPTLHSLRGLFLAQLAIGVLGVLVMSAEYATGLIRTTLAAVPQRRTLYAAKITVFGTVALVVGEAASFAGFLIGQAILASRDIGVGLGDPGVLRAVLGAGLYLALVGLLGLGLGAILRRTAGAITTFMALVLVLPVLAQALPSPWDDDVSKYLPASAGVAMFAVRPDSSLLRPGAGLLVLLGWVAATLLLGGWLLQRRDA